MAGKTNKLFRFDSGGMDLEATLFCGQSFVWKKVNNRFLGAAGGHAAALWAEGDTILVEVLGGAQADDEAFWHHYLALDTNYASLHKNYCTNKKLAACVAAAPGIRVLRQPFFDTLLSFIISQNNHLARITGIVQRLAEGFGEELAPGVWGLPDASRLAVSSREDLAPLRAGFRAKYLMDAAQRVASGEVNEAALRAACDEEAREMLCRIYGVGVKVADCVLLYALERDRVVPMDVWMKRAMERTFPRGMPRCTQGSEGIAQQYIFCWARDNL